MKKIIRNVFSAVLLAAICLIAVDAQAQTTGKFMDFDGDGKADISVFRPSTGVWYLNNSQTGVSGFAFGISTDKIVPADYDGDGKADLAAYRPSNGTWYIQRTQAGLVDVNFGLAADTPVPHAYIR